MQFKNLHIYLNVFLRVLPVQMFQHIFLKINQIIIIMIQNNYQLFNYNLYLLQHNFY